MDMPWILLLILGYLENIDCSVGGNTTRFLTLIPGQKIQYGPVAINITTNDSTTMLNSLITKTQRQNKFSMGSSVSVGGILKAFNISADKNLGFEHWTTLSSTSSKFIKAQIANSTAGKYNVEEGEVFLAAAEMEMFTYLDYTGKRRRLVLSTGTLHVGQFDSISLRNMTLDDTFAVLANKWALQTFTHQQLQDQATNVTRIPRMSVPVPGVYYQVYNSLYPGQKLFFSQNFYQLASCQSSVGNTPNHYWKFVPSKDGSGYYIYNKMYTTSSLSAFPLIFDTVFLYAGRISSNQIWDVQPVGKNKVRITNSVNGYKIGMMETGRCNVRNQNTADDQIWILKPEKFTKEHVG